MSIVYVLAYQSTISSIRFHILLFVYSRRRFTDVQSADRCCLAAHPLLYCCGTSRTKTYNYN